MKILGIDTGIANIGLALYDKSKNKILDYAHQNAKSDLYTYYTEFKQTLLVMEPTVVVFEQPYFGAGVKCAHQIYDVIGVQKMTCHELKLPTYSYTATEVKKLFTGKGNANKNDIKLKVFELFKLDISNNHCTDAIAIAYSFAYANISDADRQS